MTERRKMEIPVADVDPSCWSVFAFLVACLAQFIGLLLLFYMYSLTATRNPANASLDFIFYIPGYFYLQLLVVCFSAVSMSSENVRLRRTARVVMYGGLALLIGGWPGIAWIVGAFGLPIRSWWPAIATAVAGALILAAMVFVANRKPVTFAA